MFRNLFLTVILCGATLGQTTDAEAQVPGPGKSVAVANSYSPSVIGGFLRAEFIVFCADSETARTMSRSIKTGAELGGATLATASVRAYDRSLSSIRWNRTGTRSYLSYRDVFGNQYRISCYGRNSLEVRLALLNLYEVTKAIPIYRDVRIIEAKS